MRRNLMAFKVQFSRARIKWTLSAFIAIFIVYEFGILTHLFERDYYTRFSYPLDVDIDGLLRQLKANKDPLVKPINNYDYPFKIKNANKCKNKDQDVKVVILYVIKSALSNIAQRDAIRRSWGWENRFSDVEIRRVFVLGIHEDPKVQDVIDEEYAVNKDVVQAEFVDSYYNNTLKTMMSFRWVTEYCSKAQFIMFSDDDMYISTKNLLKFIRNPFNEDMDFRKQVNSPIDERQSSSAFQKGVFDGRLLAGFVFFSPPMRHRSSKWFISLSEYPFSMYPPYVTAGAYVVSYPALVDLFYTSMYTQLFKFDDVYLGIVAKKCRIEPLHNENFHFWKEPYNTESYSSVIASHGFSDPKELVMVWEEQRSLSNA